MSFWHGGHQVAEKSTILIVPGLAMNLSKSLVAEVLPDIIFAVISGATSADVSGAVVVVVFEALSDIVSLIFFEHEVIVPKAIKTIGKYNFTV